MTSTAYEKRANSWLEMQNLMAASKERDMTAEEAEKFDRLEADIQQRSKDIERIEKFDVLSHDGISHDGITEVEVRKQPLALPETTSAPQPTHEDRYADAFTTWLKFGREGLEPEQRTALSNGIMKPGELRALGVGTGSAGGYAVAPVFRQQIIETLKQISSVRNEAQVIQTDSGADMTWPTLDDTANVGAILAENTQVSQQDVALGTATLSAYMYTSKLVLVSQQLIQDLAFNVDEWLPRQLGLRLGRIQNQHFTTGTGTAQPEGIQTNATVGVTLATGNTTNITYAGLIDLTLSVDPAYRYDSAKFMMSDAALGVIRKLTDSQNRPLWEPSMQAGNPSTIFGYPVVINNDMPVPAANVKSVLFGDLDEAYVIRDVLGVQTLRLEERYADYLQVGFLAFLRTGARQQNAAAYRALKQSAT